MLKLHVSSSKKIGQPDYGSLGASVGLELELDTALASDPDALNGRVRKLFDLARQAVEHELQGQQRNGPGSSARDNRTSGGNGDRPIRYATASQVRAIRAICGRLKLDADREANQRFNVDDLDELTLAQASTMIDDLKSLTTADRNGGGR